VMHGCPFPRGTLITDHRDSYRNRAEILVGKANILMRRQTRFDSAEPLPGGVATPETPQEAETRYFQLAQHLIGLACPSPFRLPRPALPPGRLVPAACLRAGQMAHAPEQPCAAPARRRPVALRHMGLPIGGARKAGMGSVVAESALAASGSDPTSVPSCLA
jgi:hypothetical protein